MYFIQIKVNKEAGKEGGRIGERQVRGRQDRIDTGQEEGKTGCMQERVYSGHARGRQDGGSEAGQERGREQDRRRQDGLYAGQEGDKTVGARQDRRRQDRREGRSRTGQEGCGRGGTQDRRDAYFYCDAEKCGCGDEIVQSYNCQCHHLL